MNEVAQILRVVHVNVAESWPIRMMMALQLVAHLSRISQTNLREDLRETFHRATIIAVVCKILEILQTMVSKAALTNTIISAVLATLIAGYKFNRQQ